MGVDAYACDVWMGRLRDYESVDVPAHGRGYEQDCLVEGSCGIHEDRMNCKNQGISQKWWNSSEIEREAAKYVLPFLLLLLGDATVSTMLYSMLAILLVSLLGSSVVRS